MGENSRVAVLVFTCNRSKDLERCLNSLLKQTYKSFEIVVIDNGSADETSELLENYPVRVIYDETKKEFTQMELKASNEDIIKGKKTFSWEDSFWLEPKKEEDSYSYMAMIWNNNVNDVNN